MIASALAVYLTITYTVTDRIYMEVKQFEMPSYEQCFIVLKETKVATTTLKKGDVEALSTTTITCTGKEE